MIIIPHPVFIPRASVPHVAETAHVYSFHPIIVPYIPHSVIVQNNSSAGNMDLGSALIVLAVGTMVTLGFCCLVAWLIEQWIDR